MELCPRSRGDCGAQELELFLCQTLFFYHIHLFTQHLLTTNYVSGSGQDLGDTEKETTEPCLALLACVIWNFVYPSRMEGQAKERGCWIGGHWE